MLIIGNGPVLTNDPENPFVTGGAVLLDGDRIASDRHGLRVRLGRMPVRI